MIDTFILRILKIIELLLSPTISELSFHSGISKIFFNLKIH